jgi:3-keto-5-aminohexanoate cleavage enzyme
MRSEDEMSEKNGKVIITAALAGAATSKSQNPSVPYTPAEFAEEAHKCWKAGAAMVHVHPRMDDGIPTHDIKRVKETYDAIKNKTPELIVNLSSGFAMGTTTTQRLAQILAVKPEMASLNTNTMNFSIMNRKTGDILYDSVFENTFTMLQDFGKAMEQNGIKPEIEVYDMSGIDNALLIAKQGFFSSPMVFNFVWGVAGGAAFRPDAFVAMRHALPSNAVFTTCGVAIEEFPSIMQSCILEGHMRVGLEDNIRMPDGKLACGNDELVNVAVRIAQCLGRPVATSDEARDIMGLKKR